MKDSEFTVANQISSELVDIFRTPHGFYKNPELWKKFFNKQKGCCAICGTHQANLKTTLCVDHNHQTKKIRGLLCNRCNLLLGMAHDNPEILQKAIEYLKEND